MPFRRIFVLPIGFALLAGWSRWTHPVTESRLQIALFVGAALVLELVAKPIAGQSPSSRSLMANAGAAILAVVGVKWWLEGISLAHWIRVASVLIGGPTAQG